MTKKLHVTGGFKALLFPTYESFGGVTEELEERFGAVRGIEIRQLFEDNVEPPEDVREPAISLVGAREITRRSWPAGNELGDVLEKIESAYPALTEPTTITLADIGFNSGKNGESFMYLVPEQAGSNTLADMRGDILEGVERATGSEQHTWRAGVLDMTIAYANKGVSDRTLAHITNHLMPLLPLEVEFHPVEFAPDPRYDS